MNRFPLNPYRSSVWNTSRRIETTGWSKSIIIGRSGREDVPCRQAASWS